MAIILSRVIIIFHLKRTSDPLPLFEEGRCGNSSYVPPLSDMHPNIRIYYLWLHHLLVWIGTDIAIGSWDGHKCWLCTVSHSRRLDEGGLWLTLDDHLEINANVITNPFDVLVQLTRDEKIQNTVFEKAILSNWFRGGARGGQGRATAPLGRG